MGKYSKKQIGDILELTLNDVLSKSIEDLIDQGKRFTIAQEDEDDEFMEVEDV